MFTLRIVRCFAQEKSTNSLITNYTKFLQRSKPMSTSTRSTPLPLRKDPNKIAPIGWFLLAIPATTFGLGCWQIKRKAWKEGLLRELDEKTKAPPVPLPENLEELNTMEYRSVKVRGKFVHDKELYVGPRSFIHPYGAESRSSLMTARDDSVGYHVITPMKLAGRDETILVNRGWIPKKYSNPQLRADGQVPGEVEFVGIVRMNEDRPQFTPEHRGDIYLYRDLRKMSIETGAAPIFIDANYESSVPGGPIGGQTRVTLRNEHLAYIVTWFSLSAATAMMWYRQIYKRKAF